VQGVQKSVHCVMCCDSAQCGIMELTDGGACTCFSMRRMANSAQTVLPEPVGAATSVFSDVWYSVLNT
jgi:hypothetical protein